MILRELHHEGANSIGDLLGGWVDGEKEWCASEGLLCCSLSLLPLWDRIVI